MERAAWVDRNEYPFEGHFLDVGAGRLHYVDEGQGRPVVMVHGTLEWSFGYRHLIRGLSQSYRCIAPDHLGFGLSDKPSGWSYLPEAHAENLRRLIEHLDLKDITLIVHDFGGPIGLSYALQQPQNVRNIVLMNTWMWSLRDESRFARTRIFAGVLGRFLYKRLAFSARFLLPAAFADRKRLTPELHRQYLLPWKDAGERHGTWVFARELLGSSDWYDSLWGQRHKIAEKPALILWGMRDFAFQTPELERWKTVFRHGHVHELADVGHFVAEELGEELAPVVAGFLEAR
jgi:haloalkane dehalogenase